MPFPLVGPSYSSQAVTADCQTCMNWYIENMEDENSKAPRVLYPTPGLTTFIDTGGDSVPQLFEINGRAFAITNTRLIEFFEDKTQTDRGVLTVSSGPSFVAASPQHLVVAQGGFLHVLTLVDNTFTKLSDPVNVSTVSYADGYFIATIQDSQKFQISGLFDALSWDPLDLAIVSVFPDNITASLVDHRELVLWGRKKTTVYVNTGNPDFPWEPVPGAYIEQGCAALGSPVRLDNSVLWLGRDDRGQGMVWRAQGYTPERISTHAIETELQSYARIDDARGYAYQDSGHSFYVLYFPTANKTWVYDAATKKWHERGYWDASSASYTAHRSQCHVFVFGKHLVGDWNSGKVYEMSSAYLDDAGNPIRRARRAPHVYSGKKRIFFSELMVDVEAGLTTIPLLNADGTPQLDDDGNPMFRAPELMLRWSDDGSRTWGNYITKGVGMQGRYRTRVNFRRLGSGRDRVFEISASDPAPYRIIDADLQTEVGNS